MNTLFYGDNLDVLARLPDASVDLVYLDPPFNSKAQYNAIFKSPSGVASQSQAEAFLDTWTWGPEAARAFDNVLGSGSGAGRILKALRDSLGEADLMAYLAMMAIRLTHLHRVLKPTGSLYLHCDPTASHYLKTLMDGIFGPGQFLNEIIWKRTGSHGGARRWGPVHDSILFYSRSKRYTWNRVMQGYEPGYIDSKYRHTDHRGNFQDVSLTGAGTRKGDSGMAWRTFDPTDRGRHWAVPKAIGADIPGFASMTSQQKLDALDAANFLYWSKKKGKDSFPRLRQYPGKGVPIQDCIFDIAAVNSQARERIGYPTQKPVALMERILAASSNEGDVVLDPFCGCGTTIHAAQALKREWIGIDVTHYAVSVIEDRLKRHFPNAKFEVQGRPRDLEGARDLARRNKYQFQWWANWMIGAQAYREKKGPDGGIDGLIYFRNGPGRTGTVIISVKAGDNLGPDMVRSLGHVVEREGAELGVLVTLTEPTAGMRREAASSPMVGTPLVRRQKLQIVTARELLEGGGTLDLPEPLQAEEPAAYRRRTRQAAKHDRRQLALPFTFEGGLSKDTSEQERLFLDPRLRKA